LSKEYFVNIFLSIPYYIILLWCMARMGGVKKKVLYIVVMTASVLAINVFMGELMNMHVAAELIQFTFYPISLLIFSKSRLPKCLLASGIAIMIIFLTDESFSAVFTSMGGSIKSDGQPSMFENPGLYAFMRVILLGMLLFIAFILDRLWAILVDKTDDGTLWYFMLFPLSQGLLVYWCGYLTIHAGGGQRDYLLTSSLAVLCVAADAVMFRVMGQMRRKDAAEQRADFMAEQLRSQSARDALLIRDAEQASKVRHDMRNQIQTIYNLLGQSESELARKQLDGLTALLPEREHLCENKVADTILSQKQKLCMQSGIRAEFSCSVPADLPVDSVTLCSLFSNLLDNALAACAHAEEPWLRLKSSIQRGYFIVRCENSLPAPAVKKPRSSLSEHGWGLDILRDLSSRFDGRVETGPNADGYCTTVWLKLPAQAHSN
jgi:hypothetical protein